MKTKSEYDVAFQSNQNLPLFSCPSSLNDQFKFCKINSFIKKASLIACLDD